MTGLKYSTTASTMPSLTASSTNITTFIPPNIAVPSYSTPDRLEPSITAPAGGGASGSVGGSDDKAGKMPNLTSVGQKVKHSFKKLVGAIIVGVMAFLSFVGGMWAAIRRKVKKKFKNSNSNGDIEVDKSDKYESGHTLPLLEYQPGPAQMDTSVNIEHQPLLNQNVVRLLEGCVIAHR
jgi:hypothetical protein